MLGSTILRYTATALLPLSLVSAIDLDPDDEQSIKDASATIAYGLVKYYKGNATTVPSEIGRLPAPYYWWLGGAMFGELIEYWYYTGDSQYNALTIQGLQGQIGEDKDYQPQDVAQQLGNDDQAFWAFSCMSAAELKFPDPPEGQPSWLGLAQAVFNRQVSRWDDKTCGGGLRWQVFLTNQGYDYKNSVSNGAFFQLAARLYRYTGNETYNEWANKMYDWIDSTVMLTEDYHVLDGVSVTDNCASVHDPHEWTYNVGMFVAGCSYLYDKTKDQKWLTRLNSFVDVGTSVFSPYGRADTPDQPVLVEVSCETIASCNNEQPSFKGYLARWLVTAAQLVPSTHDKIMPFIRSSAIGAAGQCSGGSDGVTCGRLYNQTQWDGKFGIGEQMSALAVVSALMIDKRELPVSADTGGTSEGDPSAGTGDTHIVLPYANKPITTGDRAGAGILTALLLILTVGGCVFLLI